MNNDPALFEKYSLDHRDPEAFEPGLLDEAVRIERNDSPVDISAVLDGDDLPF